MEERAGQTVVTPEGIGGTSVFSAAETPRRLAPSDGMGDPSGASLRSVRGFAEGGGYGSVQDSVRATSSSALPPAVRRDAPDESRRRFVGLPRRGVSAAEEALPCLNTFGRARRIFRGLPAFVCAA